MLDRSLLLPGFAAIAALVALTSAAVVSAQDATKKPTSVLDFHVKDIDGKDVDLAKYKGKVLLIVNTASQCGYTPQYKDLQSIYEKYKDQGFEVLAFPANEFGAQEPGDNAQIKEFCSTRYKVAFPLFSKIVVKGRHPSALRIPHERGDQPQVRRRHLLELHQVPGQQEGRGDRPLPARREPFVGESHRRDREGPHREVIAVRRAWPG